MRKESVLDYGEYIAAEEILKILNQGKNKKYSIFAPISRQEKGIDLILFNRSNKKTITVQVKSSRSYVGKNVSGPKYNFLWLNNFNIPKEAKADFYIIVGNYLHVKTERLVEKGGMSTNAIDYKPIILVYSYSEMQEELEKLRQKTNNKSDKFFSFKFREESDIIIERGYVQGHNTLNNGNNSRASQLLKNKLKYIIKALN
jgi:hypothetical protein